MLEPLAAHYRVGAIETIGTDARYPVTERWQHLVEHLEHEIEHRWRGEPVFGVGHSLGGYLTLLAAVRRPELFRAIVLLDAPVIGPIKGRLLGATKRLGIVDRVTPAGMTRDRRSLWPSREDARAHLRSRKLFHRFADACLDDYVRHALEGDGDNLRLRIDPEVEYRIYRRDENGGQYPVFHCEGDLLPDVERVIHFVREHDLSLGYDHRVIDGAVADRFMSHVKQRLEQFDPNGA